MSQNWFESWFDTEYYHQLYNNRNYDEAQLFMSNICKFLNLKSRSKILDLACGKGRHSIYLNTLGYDVLGADLSSNSIEHASKFKNLYLNFMVHDMRDHIGTEIFDAVFNLFTSFGYFENQIDDQKVIHSASDSLKKNGYLVLDFINSTNAINNLKKKEYQIRENLEFRITRLVENNFIIKNISVFNEIQNLGNYQEKVRAYNLQDFTKMLDINQLTIVNTFGEYDLSPFDENNSSRLIMVAQKNK